MLFADADEPDFVWEEYLEETGTLASPPTSFKHVSNSVIFSLIHVKFHIHAVAGIAAFKFNNYSAV